MIQEDIRVKEVRELFDRWKSARVDWDTAAREDIDFYLGNHFILAPVIQSYNFLGLYHFPYLSCSLCLTLPAFVFPLAN